MSGQTDCLFINIKQKNEKENVLPKKSWNPDVDKQYTHMYVYIYIFSSLIDSPMNKLFIA